MASSLDRIKKRRQQLEIEKSNLSSDDKSLSQISLLRDEISRTGKIDYGDLGDFAPIKSRTKVDDIAPVTSLTSKGNDEYSSMSSRELWDKQQSLIKQANEYSSNTTGDDWKSIKGIWNLFSGKTANKLKEDKEYQKLQEEIAKVSKAYENKLVEEKKYDKNVMGGIEKGVDTFVGNAQTGVKGIESSFQKILGKKPDKNSTEAGLQEKFAQKARQETTGAGGIALDVLGSIGRMTPQLLIGNPIASTAMGFANYGGGAYNQAIQEGYDDDKATKYGLAIGTMEMAMTKALGAFGDIYGKTKLGNASQDVIDKLIPKIISNKQVRKVLSQFVSEGTEEFLQEYTENIAKDVLLDEKGLLKSTWKNITDTDVLSDALYSGLVGGITGSTIAIPGQVDAYRYEKRTGRNAETGLTTNEQSVMDSVIKNKTIEKQKQAALDTEVNKIIAEQEKTFGKLTEAEKTGIKKQVQSLLDSGKIDYTTSKLSKKEITEIEKQVREDLEKGYISTDIIESTLGGEEYQNYKNTQDRVDKIKNEIKKLESQNYSKLTVGEWNSTIERLNSLKEELKTIDINTLKSNLEAKMSGLINSNELLQRSYQEKSNRGVQFQADINKYTGKQRETIQKAIDSGILNNTNKTHDFVDMVAKLSADKGVSFDFANNSKLKESGFAVDGKRVNGFVTQNGITINIDSNNALNSVVGHEITHVLEGTELYTELQKAVKEYATSKGVYDTKLTELTELYKGIKDVNVENELTSDLVGEYLFTDADFVKNLSVTKPNVFQKIYNEIKYLLKVATAGSKEARQLEKVKKTFEEAYRNSQSNTTSDTQYSISEAPKQDNQGRTLTKEQQTYFKDSKLRDENGDLEVVYHSTPNQFTVFDNSMSGKNTGYENTGFGTFVTTNRAFSERFKDIDGTGKQGYTMELFANVTKPITHPYKAGIKYGDEQASKIVEDYYKAIGETEALDEMQEMIEYEEADSLYDAYMNIVQMDSSGIYENANDERMRLEDAGYDAVEIIEGYESELVEGSTSDEVVSSYAIFNSNQLKNIDNTNPTNDPDIRYSISNNSATQTNTDTKYSVSNKASLENRVSGDALLDAQDLIDEIKSVGGEVDENGYVTVYHQTSDENAQKIKETGKMISKEQAVFFSTSKNAEQAEGRGQTKLKFKIPAEKLLLDDIFSDNADVKIPLNGEKNIDVSDYLVKNDTKYSLGYKSVDEQLYDKYSERVDNEYNVVEEYKKKYEEATNTEEFKNAISRMVKEGIELDSEIYKNEIAPIFEKSDKIKEALDYWQKQLNKDKAKLDEIAKKLDEIEENNKPQLSPEEIIKNAEEHFGITMNFKETAYITTNGNNLDFSGKKDGGTAGKRSQDHREIAEVDTTMEDFVKMGNVRLKPEGNGFEVYTMPNNKQISKLYDYIYQADGEIYVDVVKDDGSYDVANYKKGTSARKIISDLETYFKTGKFPKKSEFADFYYSLSNPNEIAPMNPNLTYGEDVRLQEQIAPLQESVDNLTQKVNDIANKMDKQVIGEPVTEIDLPMFEQQREEEFRNIEYNNEPDTTYNDETVEIKIKSKKDIVNNIKENFNITAKEANALYNKIAGQPDITLEDIAAELSNYSDFKTEYTDPNVKELKRIIRNTKIDMSYLKNQITDYNNFRKSNMGKLRLGNTGTQIDTFYEELSNMYPAYLDPKIITEADQLEALSNFMNNDYNLVDEYTIDNETINNLANQIYTEIGNSERFKASEKQYKQTKKELKNLTPPVENASNKIDIKDIEPIKNDGIAPVYNDPTKERTYDEIAEILETEPKKEDTRNKRKWAIFKASVLDKGSVFEDLSLKAKNRELMGKWDYTLTSQSRAQNVIGEGHVEFDEATKTYKQTSKSLNDIRAEVDNTGLTKDFYNYIYHKHNVDRMNLEERFEDGVNKPVFGEGITSEISQQIVDEYEAAHPEFMDYAKDVYDYVNADRQQLVKEGVISQETADLWQEMYPHYVPIRRSGKDGIDINVPLDTRRTGINAPIKKAVGGSADILPLFDTMAMRTLQTYRATAKNSFGIELMNTLNTNTETGNVNVDEVIDSIDNQEGLLQEGKNGKNPTFTVFQNGEKVTYDITQDMYDALKPVSDSSFLSKTIKPLNAISKFHRGILTQYNLFFALTNAVKDAQDVLINSQHAAKTYATVPEAIAQMSTKGYWYQEYMKNGGEQNSYFDSQDNTFNPEKKGLYKLTDMFPLKAISSINDVIEMTPRLAEYIASRKAGRSIEVSMLDAARVTTNFKAGGDFTKFLNRNGANFLNASVQGFNQQVRNIREANANGLKGWASLATKFAVAGLPALLLNALLWDDDDDYEELSDYVKQNYYIVAKYGDGQFIRIPKGRTLAVIQNAMEQVQKASKGDDEADLQEFISLFLNNLAPNNPIENNVLSPIIQAATNKAWYGGDLVPTRLQNMPAAEQYDESTDSFSKWLGEKLNISPYKINYVMNQYTGFLGDMLMPMMTPEAKNDADSLGDYLIAPLKDKFTADSTMNNKYTGELFETSEKLTTNAKKTNATDEDTLKNKFINSMKSEMNELYKQKREIQNSNLSKSEKYNQVREIQKEINEISKYSLNNYEDVNINGNYAKVGNREYRFTTNSEGEKTWNKITNKQKAKQEEVSNALGINASDYWNNKEEYDYAYDSPANYGISKTIGGYEVFKTYSKELSDIKSDKDSSGKTISGSRKQKVFDYINSSNLEFEQKIILAKMEYPSYDEYNYEIIDYLNNNNDISYEEEVEILKKLGFEVDSYGNISW